MTDVDIRCATTEDIDAIRRIAEDGWNETYGGLLATETIDEALAEWYTPDTIRDRIEHEEGLYFLAEQEGTPVGYVSGGPTDEGTVAYLGAIYVDPDHWNEGIGTALLETFEAEYRSLGYEAIRLHVLAENEIARSFYRKHGYELVDEREEELFGEAVHEQVFRGELDRQ